MTVQEANSLKTCPFCGHVAILNTSTCGKYYWVSCSNDECNATKSTKEEAIDAWNKRYVETQKTGKETSEILVKLINQVSIEACIHGADTGGSYSQNKEGLVKALEDIKTHYGLVEYDIGEICNDEGWYSYGFIKRNG